MIAGWTRKKEKPAERMLCGFSGRVAERVGFEPTVPCSTPDFESGTFDHSATSPRKARSIARIEKIMLRLAPIFAAALLLLASCGDSTPPLLKDSRKLLVLTRPGPTTYTRDGTGTASGFEHDLVALFAEELGLKVHYIVAGDDAEIARKLKHGKAHLAAAWLSTPSDPELVASPAYFSSSNVIAQNDSALPAEEAADLAGKTIAVLAGSPQAATLRDLQKQVDGLLIDEQKAGAELELLERVAENRDAMALVDTAVFDIATNFYPQLQGTLHIGNPYPIVWQFPAAADPELLARANAFLSRIARDGTLARLTDRYFGHIERLTQSDVAHFIERMRAVLPKYRRAFQTAQASTGIDWRYLAALAYQESHWEPLATSPTNVRGMMMLTEDTADQMNVDNRLDPEQSIRAGSRYFADLREALPPSVSEPDRTWMATAAYNLGMGHLNGARHFAQKLKKNPDSWYEMKTVLPLLSRPEYYQRLKSGKARGGEAVIMAENVRMYYDILSRYEAPYQPGNGQLAQPAETTPANDPGPVIARLAAKRPGAVTRR